MEFFPSSQFLLDDVYDANDFDLDFDDDYEFLSDDEFDVYIEEEEYESNDLEILGGLCLDDEADAFSPDTFGPDVFGPDVFGPDVFGEYDSPGEGLPEKD